MSDKPSHKPSEKQPGISKPGMLGDGTEEQNLNQPGDSSLRIKKEDVEAAFDKRASPKK